MHRSDDAYDAATGGRQNSNEDQMYAVVRTYSGTGAKELFSLLEQRKTDVEAVMRTVPGLVSYTLVRSAEGGIAVTVCRDKAGGGREHADR
jgi:hypothetical protein